MTSNTAGTGLALHYLPAEWFDTLCAGSGAPEIIRLLWQTQRSRRLLLNNALFDEACHRPDLLGPLPAASSAWDVLGKAQATAPAEIDAILLHPQVGSWAAYALRRQRRDVGGDAPLWIDFGGIHSLALVAAAKAGMSWKTQIPLRDTHVMLPTLGMARFPGSDPSAVVDAETDGGRIKLRTGESEVIVPVDHAVDADGWWGLRRVTVGERPSLTVWLDDLDPFRDMADPVPADRLDDAAFEHWRSLLAEAWELLCRDHRADAEALADGVVSLVPLPIEEGWETRSASTGEAFGSVMLSLPPDAATMAVSLIHEFQHIKLGGLMHLLQLTDDNSAVRYYAPWRDDPRPLGGLLQGVYAFLGIAGFWRRHHATVSGTEEAVAQFEYAYARSQTDEALRIMRAAPGLTADGRKLVDGLTVRLAPWLDEPLPAGVVSMAKLTADSHRVGWRLRHLHSEPHEVLGLAKAWIAGEPAKIGEVGPAVRPSPPVRWFHGIPGAARRRLVEDGRLDDSGSTSVRGRANIALTVGDVRTARTTYLACIAERATDLYAWTGLALAVAAEGFKPAAAMVLMDRPDLVQAVYAEIAAVGTAPDPVELAAWLAPSLRSTEPR